MKIPKQNRRYLIFGGIILFGIILLWIVNPATQSIIPASNYDFHPDDGTEIEGINAKRVNIRILAYEVTFNDYKINKLSFHVEHTSSDWESEEYSGTGQVVNHLVTVPDNGDYIIRLSVEIYFYDDGAYYTEMQSSDFAVFDPDYAGDDDDDFFNPTTTSPNGGINFGEFEVPFPLLPVIIGLIVIRRRRCAA